MSGPDPFEVLGVPRGASEKAVRKAYARLCKQHPPDSDPDGFARIHTAFERALGVVPPPWLPPPLPDLDAPGTYERLVAKLDDGDYGGLWSVLEEVEPTSIESAGNAASVLRAAAVMAWRTPAAATIIHRIAPIARTHGEHAVASAAEQESLIALGFHRLGPITGLGETPLMALFGDHLLASPARRRAIVAKVREILDADARAMFVICDRIAEVDRPLARVLALRLRRESPLWGDRALAPLSDQLRTEVGRRIELIRDPTRWRRFGGAGALVAGSLAGVVFLHLGGLLFYGGLGGLAAAKGNSGKRYRGRIRPALVDILGELGVQSDTVTAWLRANPSRGGHLRPYTWQLEWDVGLDLFGSIAALVRELGREAIAETSAYR